MRNSILVTSDLKSVLLVDTQHEDHRLAIGKRGVLLSVLGNDVCATEVPAELDNFISKELKNLKPFYEFEVADAAKNQLCITYNETNNTVFIIGIRDIDVSLTAPMELSKEKVTTFTVRMKTSPTSGLASPNVILARLESTTIGLGGAKYIRFYHLSTNGNLGLEERVQ